MHFVVILATLLVSLPAADLTYILNEKAKDSKYGLYKKAAVVADNGQCAEIGTSILQKGGNAVEAIIATAICIGVMDAHSSGLGGGHFLTVYNRTTKTCTIFDARERAPINSSEDMYRNDSETSTTGWKAIGVPGELNGYWTAYKKFGGTVPWKDLWTPTIKLCKDGLKVSPALASALNSTADLLQNRSEFDIFKNPKTGHFLQAGEVMKRTVLAQTMEKIANAKDPVEFFYKSDFTTKITQEILKNGGIITNEDMKNYSTRTGATERPPIYAKLRHGMTICGPPPPSSGGITAAIISIMDGYNIKPDDLRSPENASLVFHRLVETMKFMYGYRYYLGDMDYLKAAKFLVQSLDFQSFGDYIRDRITEESFDDPYFYGQSSLKWDKGTSHMAVIDEHGNAASLTSSINTYFGSKILSNVTGIIYNNQMDDFSIRSFSNYYSIDPSPANKLVPGKRPMSSMSPLVVFDQESGVVKLAIGAEGGVRIISSVAQSAIRVLCFNQTIKEAIDAPRFHNQLSPYETSYDPDISTQVIDRLKKVHKQNMVPNSAKFGVSVTGIHRLPNGQLEANSDWRKGGGYPSGF